MPRDISGIIVLDKPIGISSAQAVARVKHLYDAKKAGHTGTLDVLATGMLLVCLGKATGIAATLLNADKTYEVEAELGKRTTTGDREGEVIAERRVPALTYETWEAILERFRGPIQQTPPMFSALKYHGTPLYVLARQRIDIERQPRSIVIYALDLLSSKETGFKLKVSCSKGTYIRTLVEDIGEAIGCGAYTTALRRLSIGHFQETDMRTMEQLSLLPRPIDCVGVEGRVRAG